MCHMSPLTVLQPRPGVSPLYCPPSLTGRSPGSGGSGAASTGSHALVAALWWGMTWPTVTGGSGVSAIRPCASVSGGIVIISPSLITFLETGCGEPVITLPEHLVMETILPGGLYTFHCTEMTSLLGSPALECGARGYNASVPVCSRGPALVTISGPGLVTRGQRPGYRCDTSPGLEEVNILWRIEGAEELASDAGWERDGVLVRSWAEMTLEVTEALDSITVECFIQSDQYSVADNMVVQIQCEY